MPPTRPSRGPCLFLPRNSSKVSLRPSLSLRCQVHPKRTTSWRARTPAGSRPDTNPRSFVPELRSAWCDPRFAPSRTLIAILVQVHRRGVRVRKQLLLAEAGSSLLFGELVRRARHSSAFADGVSSRGYSTVFQRNLQCVDVVACSCRPCLFAPYFYWCWGVLCGPWRRYSCRAGVVVSPVVCRSLGCPSFSRCCFCCCCALFADVLVLLPLLLLCVATVSSAPSLLLVLLLLLSLLLLHWCCCGCITVVIGFAAVLLPSLFNVVVAVAPAVVCCR
jgi:hypothetical protein